MTYSPLLPLACLRFNGLCLFVLPHAIQWHSGQLNRIERLLDLLAGKGAARG